MRATLTCMVLVIISVAMTSCASPSTAGGPESTTPVARDQDRATKLHAKAVDILDTDPAQAEELLRASIAADAFFGPARNNLGIVYLNRDELYRAAEEFEAARKLMPGHPDPRVNLALVYQRAGRTDEAIAAYEAALEAAPAHLPAIQGLCSALITSSTTDPRTLEFLRQIALQGTSPEWRDWARDQLARQTSR